MVHKLASRSPLGPADTAALLALPYRLATRDPGTYLVREGDRADSCIVLLSGFAYRSKMTGDGDRQILSIHLQGDLVDLQNSLLEVADHNVQALTRVELAYISQEAILDVAAAYPAVTQAFWRDTLVDASVFREWILNVGQRDARQRISHLLCELALRQEAAGICEGPRFEWPMTQEQVGDATGLTNVHVNRTLQRLREDGLISLGSKSVTITNWQDLQDAGDFNSAYLHQCFALPA
ncbi:Crp/Fnr family transcriptional regulator [Sphingobium sp. LSP13-1-1.1]|uniref:Crp/Fnr family transcriptional regulator n=1 Tax=Sphingobium sp. LSP13-1-1.1 TaxID=3135234 RepID=UPI00342CA1CB